MNDCSSWTRVQVLFLYPTMAQKTLSVLDCIPYEGERLLRADPVEHCYGSGWVPWAGVALTGAGVYCVATPLGAILAARRHAHGSALNQRLVKVLIAGYKPKLSYWLGLTWLIQFLLTGVVTLIQPGTQMQLWFGEVICLIALLLQVRFHPFKDPLCNAIQKGIYTQLLFTYMTSHVFYKEEYHSVDDLDDLDDLNNDVHQAYGIAMFVANMLAFALTILGSGISARRVVGELGQTQLLWQNGAPVELAPPVALEDGYHLFLSHSWSEIIREDQTRLACELSASLCCTGASRSIGRS